MLKGTIRKLKKIKLLNIALTGIPMNENAIITGTFMKSLEQLNPEGKPFAGYKDFDDCVRKNQDKSDPEAYCATIMRKVEGKGDDTMPEEKAKKPEKEQAEVKDFSKDIEEINKTLKSLSDKMAVLEKKSEEEDENDDDSEEKSRIEKLETELKSLKEAVEKPILKARAEDAQTGESPENENKEEKKSLLEMI